MVSVLINSREYFTVNNLRVRAIVQKLIAKLGGPINAEISISLVNTEEMAKLSQKYLKDRKSHEIISFPFTDKNQETKFPDPEGVTRLGEIVISYPLAVKLANRQRQSLDEEIAFLLDHGCRHLLGHHHK